MYDYYIDSLIKDGCKKITLSKFLTIEEQKELQTQNKIDCYFSNNYDEEIRKRAVVGPRGFEFDSDFNITIYKLEYDDHFGELKHPQILGTILSLGLSRDVVGDIIVGKTTYVIVCSEIAKYLEMNLLMINKTPVNLIKVDKIEDAVVNYDDDKIVIASLRLDLLVSKVTNLSREKAKSYINAKMVRVNGAINSNNDYIIKPSDVISITKFGRVIIGDVLGTSKKDKIILEIKKTKR